MIQLSNFQVLFCDAALLVVNKPAGLRSLPDGYNQALPHVKSVLEQEFGRLWIVHRLDKETSGVLILARSSEAHRLLNTQFEQHLVFKVYHALVIGDPQWDEKTIRLPLRSNGDHRHRTIIDLQNGKPAITHLKILERLTNYCLVEAIPETGRIHQIRAHLFALDLSIVGDKLYRRKGLHPIDLNSQTDNDWNQKIADSMKLHAVFLEINHPETQERMRFHAPYPVEWVDVLDHLRKLRG
jgi:RluA family pseudouridine synthase